MNQLLQTINSREVAKMVGRRHDQVLRDIEKIVSQLGESNNAQSSDVSVHKIVAGESFDLVKNFRLFRLKKKKSQNIA